MLRFWLVLTLLCLQLTLFAESVFPPKPSTTFFVEDYANLFNSEQELDLKKMLTAYNDSTSTQIAVVTINDLYHYEIGQYAFKLAEQWGIGQKEKDNGVLMLIAPRYRKIFIATGYGTEHKLTDAFTRILIEREIKPFFKQGLYYEGVKAGVTGMIKEMNGEYKSENSDSDNSWVLILVLVFIFICFLILIFSNKNKGKWNDDNWTGGGTWSGKGWTGGTWIGGGNSWTGGGSSGGGWSGGSFGGGSFGGGGAGGSW